MEGARFSPRKKTCARRYCWVNGCNSNSQKDLNISFHSFPKTGERLVYTEDMFGNKSSSDKAKAWRSALKMKNTNKNVQVYSLHFKKTDYILPDHTSQKRYLKVNAVPSCNLPRSLQSCRTGGSLQSSRLQRYLKRNEKKDDPVIITDAEKKREEEKKDRKRNEDSVESENEMPATSSLIQVHSSTDETETVQGAPNFSPITIQTDNIKQTVDSLLNDHCSHCSKPPTSVEDFGVQVSSGELLPKFMDYLQTNSSLSTMTGIESFEVLDQIVDLAEWALTTAPALNFVTMTLREKIVMTYVKLKQNWSYSSLAILFHISPKHCQRVFYSIVLLLGQCLKSAIPWPSKDEISRNMPKCFEGFEDVRAVIDCTEIFLQQPKNLCCQMITYSQYKGSGTVKFVTAVTPGGNISFFSKPYGGRASDSGIFKQSDIKHLLEPGDAVMVDKGFSIDEICEKNRWKCIKPPFLRTKKQFNRPEAIMTSRLAKARVLVERSNQRIKTFKILGDTMPVNLVRIVGDIFTVICGTINLSAPILADDKFIDA